MNIPALIKQWVYVIVLIPLLCDGQIGDDFSDGNFTSDPSWTGDVQKFRVNDAFQLQLNDEGAGNATLFTHLGLTQDMEWRCWVKQSFSPSGNNYSRIYLIADTGMFRAPPDGIFLQLGEGGSNDAIRLMRQLNGDTTSLIRATPGAIASSFQCGVKVLFNNGMWDLFADYNGEENYLYEGGCPGTLPYDEGYLGVYCNYTSSNSKKFYFDNFYAGAPQYDTIAPQIQNIILTAPDHLEVVFLEYPEQESAEQNTNYLVSDGIGHPGTAHIQEADPSHIDLIFPDSLPYGKLLQISITGVADQAGNAMRDTTMGFSWYEARKYDVVINEIMAAPSPPVGLPDYEYLELFNTTALPINLTGWTLEVGTSIKELTGARIEPGGYLIIGKDEAVDQFAIFGNYFGLQSFSLTNGGQSLILNNGVGAMISALYYDDTWYEDDEKEDGGWSLEQINPYNPCLLSANWQASVNNKGGSPGAKNSVFDEIFIQPEIVRVCVMDSVRIRVVFNQSIHGNITLTPQLFTIDRSAGPVLAILPEDPFFMSFILYPKNPLLPGIIYRLSYNSVISNCVGDTMFIAGNTGLGLPGISQWQDVVINEVLFNPFPGGSDFVELYNRSDRLISMTGMSLGSVRNNPPAPPDTAYAMITESCRVLLPGEYALICDNFNLVDKYYHCPDDKGHLDPEGFPAYNNEKGSVLLLDENRNVLDAFSYHENMHYPLLNAVEGVSLERLHPDRPAYDHTNWHSASQLSGFGTPGYKNSQFVETGGGEENIRVSPRVFSPGYDGHDDILNIHYQFETPGYLASIMIFSAGGQLVRHLVNNELLGTSGTYTWDGLRDDNSKASIGMYVILIELTDVGGRVVRYKKTAVIAPQ